MEDFECSAFLSVKELEWVRKNGCWDCTDCIVPYRVSRIERGERVALATKGGTGTKEDYFPAANPFS